MALVKEMLGYLNRKTITGENELKAISEEYCLIAVTNEDTAAGRVSRETRYWLCEVARAACRAFNRPLGTVTVGQRTMTVHGKRGQTQTMYLPRFVSEKIMASDRGERISPYAFTMKYPIV